MAELTTEEMKTAKSVAYRIGSKWRSVEIDDVQSELYLWLVKHTAKVEAWRSDPHGKGKLYVSLKREALRYCTRESAAKSGQPTTRDQFYSEAMLERALPFMWEQWPETTVRQDPRSGKVLDRPFEFSNAIAIMADIKGAFYGLPADTQEVLSLRFRDGLNFDEIGAIRDISPQGARQLVMRSLKRLADSLAE